MHKDPGSDDLAAEGRSDRLVPETYAKGRNSGAELPNNIERYTSFIWSAWPGRYYDPVRILTSDIGQSYFVVPDNINLFTKFAKILNQVVRKGVVVINY
jgi:hypothetical protein